MLERLHVCAHALVRCFYRARPSARESQILCRDGKGLTCALAEQRAANAALRQGQVGSGSRSEKIRTYNWKDGRCSVLLHQCPTSLPPHLARTHLGGCHDGASTDAKALARCLLRRAFLSCNLAFGSWPCVPVALGYQAMTGGAHTETL